ncbi:MAG: hypothetical protein WAN13_05380, partial [Candidatus Acidiferrales bacterium]
PKGDYYAALLNHPPQSPLKISRHASGLFHLKGGPNGTALPGTLPVRREPVGIFSGVEVLVHTGVLRDRFKRLRARKKTLSNTILLDADSAGFTDDIFFLRIYLVEPGSLDRVPKPSAGELVVHRIERAVVPWILVEIFQEKHPIKSLPQPDRKTVTNRAVSGWIDGGRAMESTGLMDCPGNSNPIASSKCRLSV